jgi:GAF domain-containing protein
VSAQTADILDIPQLLRSVSDLTKDNFGLYHAHIYLVDETGQTLSLAGGAGEIGQRLVTAGHRISLAHPHSLVAAAARSRGVVVVDDAWQVPDFLPNPLLPETRSELAVALVARNQLLGVLDVQSAVVGRFGPDIQGVMETLARQVAAALSNAQLYTLSERSSRYEHALSTITERIQGAVNMEEVLQVTARELGQALRVPRTAIALQLESAPAPQSQADDKHTASRERHIDTAPIA